MLAASLAAGTFSCPQTASGEDLTSGKALTSETGLTIPDPLAEAPSGRSAGGPFEYTPLSRIPKRYSLIEKGKQPAVRSQGSLETCWAITACSAMESALLPETDILFSPDHMSLSNGYDAVQEDGGDYYMILSYLADWKGPVTEAEDPYGDGVSPEGLTAAVHVGDMRLLRGMPRRLIQQMILTYGAAQSSLSMSRMRTDSEEYHYYREDTASYYDPFTEELDHDILVLGWDDTFPRENFRIMPARDGAWICQNSWGEDFGENGIFYVSYEDRNLFRKDGIVYGRITAARETDRVYEQDSLGWLGRQGYGQEECLSAGVFQAGRDERLSAVGFYTTGPYTAYRICLVPDFRDSRDLETAVCPQPAEETEDKVSGNRAKILAVGQIANPGFHTIDIPGEVMLREGQRYAVVLRTDTPGGKNPVAVELRKDRYTESVTTEGRATYLSKDGSRWENTQEAYSTNVCLKVFTSEKSTP